MSSEKRSSGTAGQEERKPPDGAPDSDGARSGRGHSGGRRKRLHRGGPRLSREQQGRETLLGDALLCTALESTGEKWGKKGLAKTTPKRKKTRKREANKQRAASHLELR